jgi:putative transposase
VRARLVRRAQDWKWASVALRSAGAELLSPWPVDRPGNWLDLLNEAEPERELESLRTCVNRGRPFGSAVWVAKTAEQLGLQSALRPLGRPRKDPAEKGGNQ